MNLRKLNGWQRLHVLISILYLVALAFYAVPDYPKTPIGINKKILNEFVEKNREPIEKNRLKLALASLEDFLNNKNKRDIFDEIGINYYGIKVSTNNHERLITIENYGTIKYPIDVDSKEIIKSLKDHFDNNLIVPTSKEIFTKYKSVDSIASELYKDIHRYENSDKFKREYDCRYLITIIKFGFIVICVWIMPVIVVYVLGWSIGWVYRGFKTE